MRQLKTKKKKNIKLNFFLFVCLFWDSVIKKHTQRHTDSVVTPSKQQTWNADSLKLTVSSKKKKKVLTSHWTNKIAFGPVQNSVNH